MWSQSLQEGTATAASTVKDRLKTQTHTPTIDALQVTTIKRFTSEPLRTLGNERTRDQLILKNSLNFSDNARQVRSCSCSSMIKRIQTHAVPVHSCICKQAPKPIIQSSRLLHRPQRGALELSFSRSLIEDWHSEGPVARRRGKPSHIRLLPNPLI